jgi:hypothetical protein
MYYNKLVKIVYEEIILVNDNLWININLHHRHITKRVYQTYPPSHTMHLFQTLNCFNFCKHSINELLSLRIKVGLTWSKGLWAEKRCMWTVVVKEVCTRKTYDAQVRMWMKNNVLRVDFRYVIPLHERVILLRQGSMTINERKMWLS